MLAAVRVGIRQHKSVSAALRWVVAQSVTLDDNEVLALAAPLRNNGTSYVPLDAGLTSICSATNPIKITWSPAVGNPGPNDNGGTIWAETYNPTDQTYLYTMLVSGQIFQPGAAQIIITNTVNTTAGYVTTGGIKIDSNNTSIIGNRTVYYTSNPAILTPLFYDNFNRSDRTLAGDNGWVLGSGTSPILSSGKIARGSAAGVILHDVGVADADVRVEVTPDSNGYFETYIRASTDLSAGTGTFIRLYGIFTNNTYSLDVVRAGTLTNLASGGVGTFAYANNPNTFRLLVQGNRIRVYSGSAGSTLVADVTNALIATGFTYAGFFGSGSTVLRADNFAAYPA